jgi:aryl-alcohol dehydrogenase-like predicted oxidoreductase
MLTNQTQTTFEDDRPTLSTENHAKVQKIRQAFKQAASAHHGTMVNAVIAWELMHPALTGAIIGVRSEEEAREMIGGANWKLTSNEMRVVEQALADWEETKNPRV